jgi:Alkaline phosphatase PhoX
MQSRKFIVASLVGVGVALGSSAAFGQELTNVPNANPKIVGVTNPTVLSPELAQIVRAQGSMPVENPSVAVKYYGYLNDQPNLLPALSSNVEATKTEPDKNTYLVLRGLTGADHTYDYGTRFVFQGHEVGTPGQITRINLDADAAHRVTVLATTEKNGVALPQIDGSTWYPWSGRLLFTAEGNGTTTGGVWQATPDFPSVAENLLGVFGRCGCEGIQADSQGNIWIVEDIGGRIVEHAAKVPNSFIFRFIPKNKRDLTQGGKLQALQVMSKANPGHPIAFNPASALTQDSRDLHTYGNVFNTMWITIHDTDVDGTAVFNANALAKAKLATPFKRPENGQFRPGTGFREFFFDETGDTDATTAAGSDFGGFGGVMKLTQESPSASTGTLTLFFLGDLMHTGFDNVAFWNENRVVFVEDRGDTLHTQGNLVQPNAGALDSGWMFDVRKNYADPANQPVRVIAQGRDPSATIDSGLLGTAGFQNEGDNEITGIHVSDGDAGTDGLLGAKIPRPFRDGWRVFYTQQHGDNVTYEIIRNPAKGDDRDDDRRR